MANKVVSGYAGMVTGIGNTIQGGYPSGATVGSSISAYLASNCLAAGYDCSLSNLAECVTTGRGLRVDNSHDSLVACLSGDFSAFDRSIGVGQQLSAKSVGCSVLFGWQNSMSKSSGLVGGYNNRTEDCSRTNVLGLNNFATSSSNDVMLGQGLSVQLCQNSLFAGKYVDAAHTNNSFLWNGKGISKDSPLSSYYGYSVKPDGSRNSKFSDGSFCVNPNSGLKGFYIGNETLYNILLAVANAAITKANPSAATLTSLSIDLKLG